MKVKCMSCEKEVEYSEGVFCCEECSKIKPKLNIKIDEYSYKCGDGCCDHYGTVTTVNGMELPCHNQDAETMIRQILEHLGYEVEMESLYNGEELY
jgi:hypothetical protein